MVCNPDEQHESDGAISCQREAPTVRRPASVRLVDGRRKKNAIHARANGDRRRRRARATRAAPAFLLSFRRPRAAFSFFYDLHPRSCSSDHYAFPVGAGATLLIRCSFDCNSFCLSLNASFHHSTTSNLGLNPHGPYTHTPETALVPAHRPQTRRHFARSQQPSATTN